MIGTQTRAVARLDSKILCTGAPCSPGFPVELGDAGELHAAFLTESRTREPGLRSVQEIRVAAAYMGRKRRGAAPSYASAKRENPVTPGVKAFEKSLSAHVR